VVKTGLASALTTPAAEVKPNDVDITLVEQKGIFFDPSCSKGACQKRYFPLCQKKWIQSSTVSSPAKYQKDPICVVKQNLRP
jgi:hypothetical protein